MIELIADKVKINGPRMDGSYTILLEVGEYEQGKVAQIMCIPQQTLLKVSIDIDKDTHK